MSSDGSDAAESNTATGNVSTVTQCDTYLQHEIALKNHATENKNREFDDFFDDWEPII